MPDQTHKKFRRLVREAQAKLAAETKPAERETLHRVLAARRLDLERYLREPKRPLRARAEHTG
jgi:hypothetical protein